MITLFNGGKEGVHVYQCNGAGPDFVAMGRGSGMIHVSECVFDCGAYGYCNYIQYWRGRSLFRFVFYINHLNVSLMFFFRGGSINAR